MNTKPNTDFQCNILNKEDRVEIGGVHGLDTTSLDAFQNVCSERRGDDITFCLRIKYNLFIKVKYPISLLFLTNLFIL